MRINCPICRGELEVDSAWVNQDLICPLCQQQFSITERSAPVSPSPVRSPSIAHAKGAGTRRARRRGPRRILFALIFLGLFGGLAYAIGMMRTDGSALDAVREWVEYVTKWFHREPPPPPPVSTPPPSPTPTPSPTPSPEPTVVPTPPAPVPVESPPAVDPVQWLIDNPERHPVSLKLTEATEFPAVFRGMVVGSVKVAAGTEVSLRRIGPDSVAVRHMESEISLPHAATNLREAAAAEMAKPPPSPPPIPALASAVEPKATKPKRQEEVRKDAPESPVNYVPKNRGYDKPLAPRPGYRLVEALSDEFNGPGLDSGKWVDHMTYWDGRGARFLPSNVSVSDGFLRLRSSVQSEEKLKELYSLIDQTLTGRQDEVDVADWTPEMYGKDWVPALLNDDSENFRKLMETGMDAIGAAAVMSREKTARAGYYEVRMQASNIAMSSSFWLQGGGSEFDITESYGNYTVANQSRWYRDRPYSITISTWWNDQHKSLHPTTSWTAPHKVSERFFVLGFLWEETQMKVFYNDEEIFSCDLRSNPEIDYRVFASEKHIIFDTEILLGPWMGWPTREQLLDPENNTFFVDWIRVWEPVEPDQSATR